MDLYYLTQSDYLNFYKTRKTPKLCKYLFIQAPNRSYCQNDFELKKKRIQPFQIFQVIQLTHLHRRIFFLTFDCLGFCFLHFIEKSLNGATNQAKQKCLKAPGKFVTVKNNRHSIDVIQKNPVEWEQKISPTVLRERALN